MANGLATNSADIPHILTAFMASDSGYRKLKPESYSDYPKEYL
jgi:hypothetical protein